MLVFESVRFAYDGRAVLHRLDAHIDSGQMVAFIGANGAGKTTVLKLAAGLLQPDSGSITVEGRPLRAWSRRELARRASYLPQEVTPAFAFPVALVVELGRAPYQRGLRALSREDLSAIEQALTDTATADLAERTFADLSGGERRRVLLAMSLAQQPRLLLLDEPTAHLDLRFQVEILTLVRHLSRSRGLTVVTAMHDLNLASLFFDRLLLIKDGRLLADGSPQEVLTPQRIGSAYGTEAMVLPHPIAERPQVLPPWVSTR